MASIRDRGSSRCKGPGVDVSRGAPGAGGRHVAGAQGARERPEVGTEAVGVEGGGRHALQCCCRPKASPTSQPPNWKRPLASRCPLKWQPLTNHVLSGQAVINGRPGPASCFRLCASGPRGTWHRKVLRTHGMIYTAATARAEPVNDAGARGVGVSGPHASLRPTAQSSRLVTPRQRF